MKVILKDMMQNEHLSNQGLMITRGALENNTRKINKYVLDSNTARK
jgi:hypothetical protein